MKKTILIIICILFVTGCSKDSLSMQETKPFKEPQTPKIKQEDIYNEMVSINNRLVNSDKRMDVLNEKVNIVSKQKDKSVEIEAKLQEHERVLMALMNDVVDITKSQKNLQVSNRVLHEDLEDVKIKIRNISPTTFQISKRANVRNFPDEAKPVITVWEIGKRFTAYSASGAWLKVSGEFVDGKWAQVSDELWVHKGSVKVFRQ